MYWFVLIVHRMEYAGSVALENGIPFQLLQEYQFSQLEFSLEIFFGRSIIHKKFGSQWKMIEFLDVSPLKTR